MTHRPGDGARPVNRPHDEAARLARPSGIEGDVAAPDAVSPDPDMVGAEGAMDDPLMGLVARRVAASMDPTDSRHEPFLDWLAMQERASHSPDEADAMEQRAVRFAVSVLARSKAVRVMEPSPPINFGGGQLLGSDHEGMSIAEVLAIAASAGLRRITEPPAVTAPAASGTLAEMIEIATRRSSAPVLDLRIAAGDGRDLWELPSEQWIELPGGLPRGRYLACGVGGDSMQPLLSERDTLLVRLGPRLVSGTLVVAYRPDHGYVVKQVGKVTQRAVELDSLNPAYEPIRLQRRRGTILGTVVACWHPRSEAHPR